MSTSTENKVIHDIYEIEIEEELEQEEEESSMVESETIKSRIHEEKVQFLEEESDFQVKQEIWDEPDDSVIKMKQFSSEKTQSFSNYELDETAQKELFRSFDPSYEKIVLPYSMICEHRIENNMKNLRKLLKEELEKITATQISAFDSVRIRRLYKTGVVLPKRIFMEHNKGYTYKETERLRFLMTHDVE